MIKLKYDTICIEGIDKSGKGLICKYLSALDRKYILADRGLLSYISYNEIYNRVEIDYNSTVQRKHVIYAVLTVNQEDWNIRCKITNEPKIDYVEHMLVFTKTAIEMKEKGFKISHFNTSEKAPIQVAKDILNFANKCNKLVNNEINS